VSPPHCACKLRGVKFSTGRWAIGSLRWTMVKTTWPNSRNLNPWYLSPPRLRIRSHQVPTISCSRPHYSRRYTGFRSRLKGRTCSITCSVRHCIYCSCWRDIRWAISW
jgi:hypothetical protein